MNTAYIAFGSNIGDSYSTIEKALRLIEERGMKITKVSEIIETEPYGYKEQPKFVNGAIEVKTRLSCREVLLTLLQIEKDSGRVREFKWGPRNIDLDVILYNDEIYDEEDLKVPHPDMQNRDFVLKPLKDICPDYVHPVLKKSIAQLLYDLENSDRK
ncbi:2-amino-4-hydroxy-6-hydroxymethyldihydropteridine pyrophosphokinase [Fervidicella metallireducens AeB]|uniref:2-amino-4-hydroxy-6-hydroxymethyldihydropteridine diphosphokinase n=1 Tax=Fervidicella metallireducens AeB TaxID=1403537 RepID=A0A017RY89_9CLOT|nr:2-amino-4-hydroxy-6-hydroxymethyldihydropteridine diphosphokinase [Fervidicella metallireducens]EYE89379.1 2-amino-4-hydroxy-6-hydroxymethyldihydropteridine pyrophosphokinase [Fervidicella metallireducens AeB]